MELEYVHRQCKKSMYVLRNELTNRHHSIVSLDSNFECVGSPDFIMKGLPLTLTRKFQV